MLVTESRLQVRYSETDQMGVVHHSEYIKWFEVGRLDCVYALGASYMDMEKAGFYLPVINVQASYKWPAKYDEFIIVKTTLVEYNGIRLKLSYQVVREDDGEVLVEGSTEHCWTTTAMQPVNMSKVRPDLHQKFLENMGIRLA